MLNFLLIFLSNLLVIFSCEFKPKFCVNCKFYKKDFLNLNRFGKCTYFINQNNNDKKYYLVDGTIEKNNIEYEYCSIARNSDTMCGKEGKHYTHCITISSY